MDSSDIEFKTESIKQDYQNATIKDDFDAILRKYDIKMLKNDNSKSFKSKIRHKEKDYLCLFKIR